MLLLLASAAAAPGTTTTALGLTLAWPRPAMLVDADRDAAQSVLAGWLHGADPQGRGLVGLAQAHREGRPLDLVGQCLPLTDVHSFLPGFTHPGQVALFSPVWPALAHALAATSAQSRDVLVDAGRLGAGGLPMPLVGVADHVLLVVGSSLRSLAALRHHVAPLQEAARPGAVGLLMVGPGRPYEPDEVAAQFGVPVVATLPWDPAGAAALSDGAPAPRRDALTRALRSTADSLVWQHGLAAAEIGAPR